MDVANSRMEIDQCRLLVLKAAHAIDNNGTKSARKEVSPCNNAYLIKGINYHDFFLSNQIAAIKVLAAGMACNVVDRAIQVYGGMGVCQDTPLPAFYAGARSLRIADGPDIVHMETVAKEELKQQLHVQSKL